MRGLRLWVGVFLFCAVPAAAQETGKIQKEIPGFKKCLAYVPGGYNPGQAYGLILALHGTGGSGPLMTRGFDIGQVNNAGYLIVLPTSHNGGWGITRGGREGREKDLGYIRAVMETFTRSYNIHPDKIHIVGYSAGSVIATIAVGKQETLDPWRIRSLCLHSGGTGGRAEEERASETSVWVLNGERDSAHAKPSKNMYLAFKDAGYDARYEVVPGKGHMFSLIPIRRMFDWWKKLDAGAPDIVEITKALERAAKELEKEKWGRAWRAYQDAKEAAGGARRYAARIDAGLAKIEAVAKERLGEAASAGPGGRKKLYKAVAKQFKGTPYEKEAKAAQKKLK